MTDAPRPILILDCVHWDSRYDASAPLANVGNWYRKAWGANSNRLEVHHVDEDPLPSLERFAGVVLTGSPSSAYEDLPWIERLEGLIRNAVANQVPLLGVCFGHQIVAQALGGRVEPNPNGWEVGNPEVELTEEGRLDPLFEGLPPRFRVIQSHRDMVTELPPGARLLASSDVCRTQAYSVGEQVRCVQFHPEMNAEILRFLLTPRRAMLLEKAGIDIDQILPRIGSTAESRGLFRRFEEGFIDKPVRRD